MHKFSTLLKKISCSSSLAAALVLGLSSLPACSQQGSTQLNQLADEHRWSELRDAAAKKHSAFYQAMAAAVFNEPEAEQLLRATISEEPTSEEAYEAYDWLSNIYLKSGRYHSLEAVMEARWAAFPNKQGNARERAELAPLRGLPDQENGQRTVSVLTHDPQSLSVSLTINGSTANFFFDDGADISSMSEEEARSLGMTISSASGAMHSMTKDASFRMAVAKDVVIGKMHFRNVSFAVFPDNQEPWSLVPKNERGIIGLPIMVGMGNFAWSADGTIRIGEKSQPLEPKHSNLFFDGGKRPVVTVKFQGADVFMSLDTGAMTTDVYSGFARRFPEYLAQHGTKSTNEIRGIGGTQTFEAIHVSELPLTIGGQQVSLKPVSVMTEHETWRKWVVANLGKDLLMQTGGFRIDFDAMRLSLRQPLPQPPEIK